MIGGRTRTRTWDPLIKSQLLYQLSYAPPEAPSSHPSCAAYVLKARKAALIEPIPGPDKRPEPYDFRAEFGGFPGVGGLKIVEAAAHAHVDVAVDVDVHQQANGQHQGQQ